MHVDRGSREWTPTGRIEMTEDPPGIDFDTRDALAHLGRTPRVLRSWLDGQEPSFSERLDEFGRLREANLAELHALEFDTEALRMPGTHPAPGPVNVEQLLATWTVHDLTHIAQIARVMAKQYREQLGPWRQYLPLLDRPTGTPDEASSD